MTEIAFSVAHAAAATNVSQREIEGAIHAGELIARRVGTEPTILATDIQAWLQAKPVWTNQP